MAISLYHYLLMTCKHSFDVTNGCFGGNGFLVLPLRQFHLLPVVHPRGRRSTCHGFHDIGLRGAVANYPGLLLRRVRRMGVEPDQQLQRLQHFLERPGRGDSQQPRVDQQHAHGPASRGAPGHGPDPPVPPHHPGQHYGAARRPDGKATAIGTSR